MFESLKDNLPELAVALGKLRTHRSSRALLIPPAGPGSVGDAAMISASVQILRDMNYKVDLLQVEHGAVWDLDASPDQMIPAGDFMTFGSRTQLASLIYGMAGYSDVIMIGADILDGVYDDTLANRRLMLLDRAARMGLRATVLGSSFSLTPAPSTVAVLRSLPRRVHLYARDDLSHGRMATALGRKIEISADVVFLLKDVAATPELEDDLAWIAAQRNTGARIVAVNANALQEVERPDLVARYVDLISSLLSTAGVSIVLLPHDTRGDRSDVALAGEIRDGLGADLADRVRLVPPRNPGSVKAIVKASDLLITGRMHAAVLGLTSGTPAISFSYQGKFEGLYRHLGLDPASYVFPTQALDDDLPGLLEACTQALDRSGELRMRILEQLPKLQALSRRNVEHLAFPVQ